MRIACISASQVPSTTANSIQVMKACQALALLGHEVKLFLPSPGVASGLTGHTDPSGGEKWQTPNWDRLSFFYGLHHPFQLEWIPANPRLRRYDFSFLAVQRARKFQADLLYIWPIQAAVIGLALGMPVAVELHGPPEGKLGPGLFRLARRLPGKKRWLPITSGLLDLLREFDGRPFPEGEVVILPNGVELERYDDLPGCHASRLQLGLPQTFTAGYTGHLYPGRGMSLLVELSRRFPQIQFLWVGGRPEDAALWRKQLENEQIHNVILTGFVENRRLPLYQAAAEVLLMPYERVITGSSGGDSARYCSPMKLFEYMASGRAILSSDLPVLREVLNESNSILCEPEDVMSWSSALSDLLEDPEKRIRLGRQARLEAAAFTWTRRAQKALQGFLSNEDALASG